MRIIFFISLLYLSSLNAGGFFHKYSHKDRCYGDRAYECKKRYIKKIDEIDTEDFNLFVKKVKNIGGDLVIYIQFRSKDGDFDIDLSQSRIVIKDKRGRRISIDNCEISNFHIESGEAKIFPLIFEEKANKLKSPYTLYLEIYDVGKITLTDLKLGSESIEY